MPTTAGQTLTCDCPGNAGIAEKAECVHIADHDIAGLLEFVREKGVNLTVVGQEVPLSNKD